MKKIIIVQGIILGCAAVASMYLHAYTQYSTYIVKIINNSPAAYEVHCHNYWLLPVYKQADLFGSDPREFPVVEPHSTLEGIPCRILIEKDRISQKLSKVFLQKIKDAKDETANLPEQINVIDTNKPGQCLQGSIDITAKVTTHECVNNRGFDGKIALIIQEDGNVTIEQIPFF